MNFEHCHPHPHGRPVDMKIIEDLWGNINKRFATNKAVLELAAELKKIEMGMDINTNQVAQAAAAMVLKSVADDLDKLNNGMGVEVVPFTDKHGFPVVPEGPDFNTLYLTPANTPDECSGALWDEWIALPIKKAIGSKRPNQQYKWERVGNKAIDLSWIKEDIAKINGQIKCLNAKMSKYNKMLAHAILDKAVRPLRDLQKYVHSPEYVAYVFEKLPRASMGTDGLMSANQFTILSMLAVWAANDHKILGGGALGPDVVIHMLDKVGVPTDDLRKRFHHHACCECEGDKDLLFD